MKRIIKVLKPYLSSIILTIESVFCILAGSVWNLQCTYNWASSEKVQGIFLGIGFLALILAIFFPLRNLLDYITTKLLLRQSVRQFKKEMEINDKDI